MDVFFLFCFLALASNGRGRKTPSEWMLGWSRDIERPSYYHLQGDAQASRCVYYVPYMQLLSVDFSFRAVWLLTVHQILISGARDEPSSNHIRHGEAITAGPFFSHGVFSQWQAHWLCWFWTRSSPLSLRRGTSPRYTDRDGRAGGDTQGRVRHTSGSLACDGNHVVYHSSPAALSACAMLRDIPEDCHIVWEAARHQDPQMAHSEQTRARPIIVLSLRRAALTVYWAADPSAQSQRELRSCRRANNLTPALWHKQTVCRIFCPENCHIICKTLNVCFQPVCINIVGPSACFFFFFFQTKGQTKD